MKKLIILLILIALLMSGCMTTSNDYITNDTILNADEILAIENWREPESLLRMCSFIAVTRPGFTEDDVKEQTDMLKAKYGCDIYFTEVPALDISSSDLRRRIKTGESIKYLVPKEVEKYISEHNLYKE